jgi:hypothetical protein
MTNTTLAGRLLLVLAAGVAGCNGDSLSSPMAPSTLAPPTTGPSDAVSVSHTVPAAEDDVAGSYMLDVTMPRSGAATVTLSGPNGDFSLQMYVTSGACADASSLATGACAILGRTRPGDRPGVVRSSVTGGDLNTIWVLNTDPAPQDFTVVVDVR